MASPVLRVLSTECTNGKTVRPSKQAARTPCQEVVEGDERHSRRPTAACRACQPSRAPEQHLEDLQKACVLRWRGSSEGTTTRFAAERSGEDAGIRALLSRVGACRAEGGRRFARVSSCRSAVPTPTNTDLREARVLCGCIRAVGCYAGQTICMEDPTALVIGRGEQRICTSSPTGRALAGRSARATREEATAVAVVTMMCYAATDTCRAVMAFDCTALHRW
jgi:hypothetical protein